MLKISAILLLFLGMLPGFPQKEIIAGRLEEKFKVEEKIITYNDHKVPDKKLDFQEISIEAKSAYFADYDSGYVFYKKASQEKLPMASTTKLMTALLVVERLDPDKIIEIDNLKNRPLDAVMGLGVGDKVKASELLHGLLIESGADAARALANEVGGTEENFVALMNETAKNFGLENTQFTNSIGYDDNGHYSTVEDLYKLSKIALVNPTIKDIVSKRNYVAKAESGKIFQLNNTNKLLVNQNVKGVKTGTTFLGGECLIALYDNDDKKILGILLNSPNRFTETNSVFGWTNESFTW